MAATEVPMSKTTQVSPKNWTTRPHIPRRLRRGENELGQHQILVNDQRDEQQDAESHPHQQAGQRPVKAHLLPSGVGFLVQKTAFIRDEESRASGCFRL